MKLVLEALQLKKWRQMRSFTFTELKLQEIIACVASSAYFVGDFVVNYAINFVHVCSSLFFKKRKNHMVGKMVILSM